METFASSRKLNVVVVILVFSLVIVPHYRGLASAGEAKVERLLEGLSLEEKIGQMIMARVLEGPDGKPSERTKQLIQQLNVGSLLFYSFKTPGFAARQTNQMQKWAENASPDIPLLIGSDFEFGPKTNIYSGATSFPQQMGIGATGKPELAREAAAITAKEGRAMGIHWNFSPVADVNSNRDNPVIGVRSYGASSDEVSEFAEAAVRGYQDNGLIATPKHYPGHGDTSVDSHYDLPKVSFGREKLERHLAPFRAGINAGADAIMTAHIIVEDIDPDLPATLSRKILTGLLREDQGFEGVIVTDALNMEAIEENFGKAEAAIRSVRAGSDVLMSAGNYWDVIEVHDGLVKAVKNGEITEERIDQSVRRILKLKIEYGLFSGTNRVDPEAASEIAGKPASRRFAEKLASEAITLVKNEGGLVPLKDEASSVALIGVKDSVKQLKNELEKSSPGLDLRVYRTPQSSRYNSWSPSEAAIDRAVEVATGADYVVLLTYSRGKIPRNQVKLVKDLLAANENLVVVAEGLPYDIERFPEVPAYVATYAYNRWNSPAGGHDLMTEVTAKLLAGEIEPGGSLPVPVKPIDGE